MIADAWASRWARHRAMDVSLGETRARMLALVGLGVILGGAGGAAAFVVVRLVALLSNLALLHRVGWRLPNLAHYQPGWALVPVAVGGALVVVALARYSPVIKGHGIPETLEAIALRRSRISPRAAVAKPISAAVAMGTGGPFGAEGPIIVTGGSIGSLLGQLVAVSADERRILLATGAAAGMAGVFGTPVAAVLIAFELLLLERSLRGLLPLLAATSLATAIHEVLLGSRPLFALRHAVHAPVRELWLFVLLGLAVGLLAALCNRGLFAFEAGFARLPVPEAVHPLLGAVGFAAIGYVVPGSLSVGYWAITDAVNGTFALHVALVLFVGKLVSWWVALASNTSGGTLAPMFLVGATMGESIGIGFVHLLPTWHVQPAAFALVAMGATFGVAARALLTGAVFALEVTGGFALVVPMLVCLAVAEVVAEQLLSERIMTDKLFRRGFRVELDAQVVPLRRAVCGQLMRPLVAGDPTPGAPRVDRYAFAEEAVAALEATGGDIVVVTDEGEAVGTVHRLALDRLARVALEDRRIQPPCLPRRRLGRRRPAGGLAGGDVSHDDGAGPSARVRSATTVPAGRPAVDGSTQGVLGPRAGQEEDGTMPGSSSRGTSGLSDADYQAILAFRDRLRGFLRWSEEEARSVGLTPAQHQLLLAVRGHPGSEPPTVKELAEHLLLRHHSVVGLVDRAEASGLVRRCGDPSDRRLVRVTLEPAGEAALERLTASHLGELRQLVSALGRLGTGQPWEAAST